eukprot:TRINITY_DN12477_c1_g5_i2.p1 TRINITY_DN12477_c1_g5~~TRINITY_DN12477_c1_g5_i2.p1  ORF type:complete len:327 (+),score=58.14 TRINITY_DN12477_c1_g5_i2:285-1265(+)
MMDLADFRLRLSVFYELKGIGVNVAHTKSEQRALKRSSRSATADDGSVIFGGNLSALVDEKSIEVDGLKVPKFLADIVEQLRKGLGTVGLFRIPGNSQRMKALRAELSCGKTIHGVPSDLASLLKAFFRELQEPLFTFGFFNGFIAAYKVADEELRKKAVLMLCCLLEEEHLHTLVLLMRLLQDVAKEPANQMDASSLASILTPNLLKPRDQAAVTSQMELANHASCVGVVEMLIKSVLSGMPLRQAPIYRNIVCAIAAVLMRLVRFLWTLSRQLKISRTKRPQNARISNSCLAAAWVGGKPSFPSRVMKDHFLTLPGFPTFLQVT